MTALSTMSWADRSRTCTKICVQELCMRFLWNVVLGVFSCRCCRRWRRRKQSFALFDTVSYSIELLHHLWRYELLLLQWGETQKDDVEDNICRHKLEIIVICLYCPISESLNFVLVVQIAVLFFLFCGRAIIYRMLNSQFNRFLVSCVRTAESFQSMYSYVTMTFERVVVCPWSAFALLLSVAPSSTQPVNFAFLLASRIVWRFMCASFHRTVFQLCYVKLLWNILGTLNALYATITSPLTFSLFTSLKLFFDFSRSLIS